MTVLNIAYLAMALGAWLAFAVVVMWATRLTNPAPKALAAPRYVPGDGRMSPLAG